VPIASWPFGIAFRPFRSACPAVQLRRLHYSLFDRIIREGYKNYNAAHDHDASLNETNFLKKDVSYFKILKQSWDDLKEEIDKNKALFL